MKNYELLIALNLCLYIYFLIIFNLKYIFIKNLLILKYNI